MQRLGTLAVLSLTLFACQDAPTPPTESFQFPMAVFVQGKPNDFWDAVLNGMRQRLNMPGVQLETSFSQRGARGCRAARR
jgi:ABC-type sugar transport system substrate-binding protein